jgi:prepilin signal peptidase PulO-like enzyme (type II secretory pathway)
LKGKCRGCRSKIGWPTIFIELTMTAWGFFVHFFFPNDYLTTIFVFLFGGILLAIAITDFKQKEIPWVWLIAGGILAMVRIFVFFYQTGSWPATEIFLSVIIGAGWFAWQYLFSRGRWVGNGDIYLGGMLGLIHASSVLIILNLGISYIVGALYAVSLLLAKKSGLKSQIPFGPFLAIGAAIIMLFWW